MRSTIFYFLIFFAATFYSSCSDAETYTVHFKVELDAIDIPNKVELIGNQKPLSWKRPVSMAATKQPNVFETYITFKTDKPFIYFKFVADGTIELEGSDNRYLNLERGDTLSVSYQFNELEYYTTDESDQFTFTPEQIKKDIAILKEYLTFIHPSLYTFQSEADFEQALQTLESKLLAQPNLAGAYKHISRFAATIQCSHTFTNPWNQNKRVKRAFFYTPDKIPFTFTPLGNRLFVDRNASEEPALKAGLEILSINGISTQALLAELSTYIAADGKNDAKRIERLTVNGVEKFSLFDIFFPLVFGSTDTFQLQLKDHSTGQEQEVNVKAISKTKRDQLLKERYPDFGNSFADLWQLDYPDAKTAYLKAGSFAVFNTDFDWKGFIDESMEEIIERDIERVILDIRGNEGGEGKVALYLLSYFTDKKVELPPMEAYVNYLVIPDSLKEHIGTWDKFPYDMTKYATKENGRYRLKQKYTGKPESIKPRKKNFKGKTYLLTDASNSSATHLMATYVKALTDITLVGQTTGGNQLGTNGGYMFFLNLPNLDIEVDIPVIKQQAFPVDATTPNGGIEPDIVIEKNIPDFVNGIDTELQAVSKLDVNE